MAVAIELITPSQCLLADRPDIAISFMTLEPHSEVPEFLMPPRQRDDPGSHDSAQLADEALAEALELPNGPERSEALKKASQLRIAADKHGIRFAKRGRPSKSK